MYRHQNLTVQFRLKDNRGIFPVVGLDLHGFGFGFFNMFCRNLNIYVPFLTRKNDFIEVSNGASSGGFN